MARSRERLDQIQAEMRARRAAHIRKGRRTGQRRAIPSTREEAIRIGARWYRMDVPCGHGHLDVRDTISKLCRHCCRLADRRRQKDYPRVYFWGAKSRAKILHIPFSLTVQHVRDVWPVDNKCPVFGTEFTHDFKKYGTSPSIDRIIPEVGYVHGNIAIISRKANEMKSNETRPEAFRRLADWMEITLKSMKSPA